MKNSIVLFDLINPRPNISYLSYTSAHNLFTTLFTRELFKRKKIQNKSSSSILFGLNLLEAEYLILSAIRYPILWNATKKVIVRTDRDAKGVQLRQCQECTHRVLTVTFTWPFSERENARMRSHPCSWRSLSFAGSCQRTVKVPGPPDVRRYKFERYKQRQTIEVEEPRDGGMQNDSRWLSGGVPEPAYLLTLSSRIHPSDETRTRPITDNTLVPRLRGVVSIAPQIIVNCYFHKS